MTRAQDMKALNIAVMQCLAAMHSKAWKGRSPDEYKAQINAILRRHGAPFDADRLLRAKQAESNVKRDARRHGMR